MADSGIATIHVPAERLAERAKVARTPEPPRPAPAPQPSSAPADPGLDPVWQARLQAELETYAQQERERMGLGGAAHFKDVVHDRFTAQERGTTTILVSGLTIAHDSLVVAGLRGLGYRVQALDCPDYESLRYGKEFGNRGQCNPTYFTVGNLVKFLSQLRDGGMDTREIVQNYVFLTAGACGPCRFGSYITEYRKALRDAGFDGFRVALFQQKGGLDQEGEGDVGLVMNGPFFVRILLSLMIGDALNALMYRIRPYEVVPGSTDAAIADCKAMLVHVLQTPGELPKMPWTLLRVRHRLAQVAVDRRRVKPKVGIIGEFWAMTTEGDGNYKMPTFLEAEGAEVDVQLVTAWLLYNLWEVRWDTRRRMGLEGKDQGLWGLADKGDPGRKIWAMHVADRALRGIFQSIAHTMGLHGYTLPDMEKLAEVTQGLYHEEVRGGEGHMEVAKLLLNTRHRKVNLTLSVKPFGCMPSSGVSDGVQTVVQAIHPEALYLPVETTGDGAVNVYSRVQMMLFKARQQAHSEVADAAQAHGVTVDEVQQFAAKVGVWGRALYRAPHTAACTAADVTADAARWLGRVRRLRAAAGLA
ncbi:MAG: 2-hydroxyglutaryl-CoA dehydratase [Deltaproteobacteria bacterium]|nr:2-hydroxyglutaryl-CoA dehydratase [Deltaproteobacteria bacterium]